MEFKDYYKVLGLERGADQKAVRAAFRKLARRHHPDINKAAGAEESFKEINEAYQVLGDADKRARYDQMYEAYQRGGMDWQQVFRGAGPWGQSAGPGGWTVTFEGRPEDLEDVLGGFGGFSDFFRQFFGGDLGGMGGGRTRPGTRAGRARNAGTRRAAGAAASPGAVAAEDAPAIEVTLDEAFHGARKPVTVQLDGTLRRLDVTIPKGVRDGQRIRLPGALDGGDLLLTVRLSVDPRFERREDDLVAELPVPLTDALLGATVKVPTMEGSVEMTIPPETQNGQVFRLRGQGMPRREGGRGDQLVRIKVVLPRHLSARERELLAELARLRKEAPQAR